MLFEQGEGSQLVEQDKSNGYWGHIAQDEDEETEVWRFDFASVCYLLTHKLLVKIPTGEE